MAIMHPKAFTGKLPNVKGEKMVFDALEVQLSKEFTVLYSADWMYTHPETRTTRKGEADFVIAHPDFGLLVLEIKGGAIKYDADNEKYTQTSGGGRGDTKNTNPYSQVNRNKHNITEIMKLVSGRTHKGQKFAPHGDAVIFPQTSRQLVTNLPIAQRDITFFEEDLIDLGPKLSRLMEDMDSFRWEDERPDRRSRESDVRKIIKTFKGESWESTPGLLTQLNDAEIEIKNLEEELTDRLGGSFRGNSRVHIRGGAGTGKTIIGLKEALRIGAQGNKVLWLCFNQLLRDYASDKLKAESNITINTFDAFRRSVILKSNLLSESDLDDIFDFSKTSEDVREETFRQAIGHEGTDLYDVIIIDEAQDMENIWLEDIEFLLADQNDSSQLILLGDDNQNLYRAEKISIDGFMNFSLNENLRNTPHIHAYARGLYHDGGTYRSTRTIPGPRVEWISVEKDLIGGVIEDKLQKLVDEKNLKEGVIKPSAITVLTGASLSTSAVSAGEVSSLVNLALYSSKLGENEIGFDTIRRFKGLENQVIILTEIDPDDENFEVLTYVGITRARTHLIVVDQTKTIEKIKRLVD